MTGLDEGVLPAAAAMLDALLEAATLARPGIDAEGYAEELRALAAEAERLTRELEAVQERPDYAAAA